MLSPATRAEFDCAYCVTQPEGWLQTAIALPCPRSLSLTVVIVCPSHGAGLKTARVLDLLLIYCANPLLISTQPLGGLVRQNGLPLMLTGRNHLKTLQSHEALCMVMEMAIEHAVASNTSNQPIA